MTFFGDYKNVINKGQNFFATFFFVTSRMLIKDITQKLYIFYVIYGMFQYGVAIDCLNLPTNDGSTGFWRGLIAGLSTPAVRDALELIRRPPICSRPLSFKSRGACRCSFPNAVILSNKSMM